MREPAHTGSDAVEQLRANAAACRRCPLWSGATQTVFGEGPRAARAILAGEQPGDREDIVGRPFVGPAGRLLDVALERAGLSRGDLYLTNAVKHFKNEPRGKKRLHKTPSAGEIDACRFWLDQELALVDAPVVIALGATALSGLGGTAFRGATISSLRGRALSLGARKLIVTVHPAAILRVRDSLAREQEMARFVEDMAAAR